MGSDSAYAELGLAPGASDMQVKAAWRRLVSQWHPDRNRQAGAIDKMQRINRAFEQIRRNGFADDVGAPRGSPGAKADPPRPPEPPPAPEPPPRTISRRVRLTLEEAATGCTRTLRGKLDATCTACAGSGARVLAHACPRCAGTGTVRQTGWYGWLGTAVECEACAGTGQGSEPCPACEGSGASGPSAYKLAVRIPHGVRDGDLLHVPVHRAGPGRPALGLDLRVELLPHALYTLAPDGTLRCTVPVDGFAWAAGREVAVPTLAGLHRLQLDRQQLEYRLPGLGFPRERRGPPADLSISILPIFPERLSTDRQILLDQLVATASDPRLDDWAERLRLWENGRERSQEPEKAAPRTRKGRGEPRD